MQIFSYLVIVDDCVVSACDYKYARMQLHTSCIETSYPHWFSIAFLPVWDKSWGATDCHPKLTYLLKTTVSVPLHQETAFWSDI